MKFNTALLHSGKMGDEATGATLTPVYQSSAFYQPNAQQHEKLFHNKANGFSYTRINNPTIVAFENKMTALEKGIASIACASGMAAITNALLNIVNAGQEIVASSSLYGGSIDVFHDFEAFGITTHFVDVEDEADMEKVINENTRVIFAETIGNPKLDVVNIKKLADFAHDHGLPLVMDNTVATAYLVRPIELGADVVVNSTSKYINGNSDAISGVITDSGKFKWDKDRYPAMKEYSKYGKFAYTARLRNDVWRNMGGCLAPMNAYLNILGLETLGIRMKVLCHNALTLAKALEELAGITVNYPGLESSPYKPLVDEQFGGLGGAILTIRAGSREKAFKLINSLKYAHIATNIGDLRTLVIHPSSTIYLHSTKEEQEHAGVYEDTIRISVGIEDVEDLIADFTQAIENI